MILTIVVAVADNGVIGRDNDLPWRIPADLKHFKAATMGKPILMGRKTFESIGKPLPGRLNVVITRNEDWSADGVTVVHSLMEAVSAAVAAGAEEACVIGGAEIYAQALNFADRLVLTEVHAEPEGDTRFPDFDRSEWEEVSREAHAAEGDTPAFDFVVLSPQ